MRVQKYQVYTEEELLENIREKYQRAKREDYKVPLLVELVLNLLVMGE